MASKIDSEHSDLEHYGTWVKKDLHNHSENDHDDLNINDMDASDQDFENNDTLLDDDFLDEIDSLDLDEDEESDDFDFNDLPDMEDDLISPEEEDELISMAEADWQPDEEQIAMDEGWEDDPYDDSPALSEDDMNAAGDFIVEDDAGDGFDSSSAESHEKGQFSHREESQALSLVEKQTQLLEKIESELSTIKDEILDIRSQLVNQGKAPHSSLDSESQPLSETESKGFFDEDDDESIVLTGDELDNIINTAEMTNEEGSSSVPPSPVINEEDPGLSILSESDPVPDNIFEEDSLADGEPPALDDINLTSEENEEPSLDDDLSLGEEELSLGDDDLVLEDDDPSFGKEDISLGDDDLALEEESSPLGSEEISFDEDDLSIDDDDLSLGDDDELSLDDDLSLDEEDLSLGDDDFALEEENSPLRSEEISFNEDDLSLGDQNLTLEEDNSFLGDDDELSLDDDLSLGEEDLPIIDEEELSLGDDDSFLGNEDISLGDGELPLSEEELSLGDDDLTLEEENSLLGNDEISFDEDDLSLGEEEISMDEEEVSLDNEENLADDEVLSSVEDGPSFEEELQIEEVDLDSLDPTSSDEPEDLVIDLTSEEEEPVSEGSESIETESVDLDEFNFENQTEDSKDTDSVPFDDVEEVSLDDLLGDADFAETEEEEDVPESSFDFDLNITEIDDDVYDEGEIVHIKDTEEQVMDSSLEEFDQTGLSDNSSSPSIIEEPVSMDLPQVDQDKEDSVTLDNSDLPEIQDLDMDGFDLEDDMDLPRITESDDEITLDITDSLEEHSSEERDEPQTDGEDFELPGTEDIDLNSLEALAVSGAEEGIEGITEIEEPIEIDLEDTWEEPVASENADISEDSPDDDVIDIDLPEHMALGGDSADQSSLPLEEDVSSLDITDKPETFTSRSDEAEHVSSEKALSSSSLMSDMEMMHSKAKETSLENLPDDLKEEIREILTYMDQLLESLPEDKIQEFAQSEHFEVYKKIFEELGISN